MHEINQFNLNENDTVIYIRLFDQRMGTNV